MTLCVTSREKTNLPGEHIEEIYGLEDAMGGALFYENVSTRKDALNEAGLEKLSAAVGGHPLALRLLAPIFEEQAGLSLEQFIERLQTFLPKASDQWTEQQRHESLGACFAFSMDNLPKNEEGKELQSTLARLSVFIAFFAPGFISPVIANKWPETEEEEKEQDKNAERICHALWERGLLERVVIPLKDENFYLYRLHPALGFFAKERLSDSETAKENYWKSMSNLARIAEDRIKKSSLMARVCASAMPDLLSAAEAQSDEASALMQLRVSKLLCQFGLYDDSMRLLEKSRDTYQTLNNLKGKSAALHDMANIFMKRGGLDEAMKLYQQALKIDEGLGDLEGKSITLGMMAHIYVVRGDFGNALKLYQLSLDIKESLKNLNGKALTLQEMAYVYFVRGEIDSSLTSYQQSFTVLKELGDYEGMSTVQHNVAKIYVARGEMESALSLLQQSLEISEGLANSHGKAITLGEIAKILVARGDLEKGLQLQQEKLFIVREIGDRLEESVALHNIAGIYARRGELDAAIQLYEQALEIKDVLGDLKGKSATLAMFGQCLIAKGEIESAIKYLLEGFQTAQSIGAHTDAKNIAAIIAFIQSKLGAEAFDAIWKKITDSPIPDWLAKTYDEDERDMVVEQLIAGAIQSAREKRPEAEEYFKSAQKMAADSSVPAEMRELGKVLQRIMIGDRNVDLSFLPREWAELVMKKLGATQT